MDEEIGQLEGKILALEKLIADMADLQISSGDITLDGFHERLREIYNHAFASKSGSPYTSATREGARIALTRVAEFVDCRQRR